jgi:triosephosphate isomerase (TIM)
LETILKDTIMPRKLVIGNWKMNGSLAANATLAKEIAGASAAFSRVEVIVCPPFPYLASMPSAFAASTVKWGAQDVSAAQSGAYTGQVSAPMLKEFGCSYVLVGHSERRQGLGESDTLVAEKAKRALEAGLIPVVCVGETLAQREAGQADAVVLGQLNAVTSLLGQLADRIIVAYEPVWAIGTGKTASAQDAQAIHATLRQKLNTCGAVSVPILYGGSVKADNATSLFAMPDIDGGLIGGAALDAKAFLAICAARQSA